MLLQTKFLCFFMFIIIISAHPTMYKLNDDLKLEPDLVAVSSTVIPLPIYKVGFGIDVAKGSKEKKTTIQKPDGPITLITANKKKTLPIEKVKSKST